MTLDHDGDEQHRQNHDQRNRGTGIGRTFGLLRLGAAIGIDATVMVAVILAVRSGGHSGNGNGQHDRGLIGRTSHGQADITGLGSGGNRDLELGGIAIRDLRFADHLLADGGGQLRLVRHTQRGKRKLREVQRERIASLDRAGRDGGDVHCAAVSVVVHRLFRNGSTALAWA